MTSFWNTLEVGQTDVLGSHLFTAEDIKRFAARYDPQAFHLDEEAAKSTLLGGLCASGWHTAAVFMRLNVAFRSARLKEWEAKGNQAPAVGPSPGVKNLKWMRPVYAGDTLTYRQTITAKRESESRPGWGVVETRIEAENQDGKPAFRMDGAIFIETR